MIPVYREDLPCKTQVWACDACPDTSCEVTARNGAPGPAKCPLGLEPSWRLRRCTRGASAGTSWS